MSRQPRLFSAQSGSSPFIGIKEYGHTISAPQCLNAGPSLARSTDASSS